jgi:hypothetical protein
MKGSTTSPNNNCPYENRNSERERERAREERDTRDQSGGFTVLLMVDSLQVCRYRLRRSLDAFTEFW